MFPSTSSPVPLSQLSITSSIIHVQNHEILSSSITKSWFTFLWNTDIFFKIYAPGLSCSMWTLSCGMHVGSGSLMRDRTWAPCIGSVESYPLDHQVSPWNIDILESSLHSHCFHHHQNPNSGFQNGLHSRSLYWICCLSCLPKDLFLHGILYPKSFAVLCSSLPISTKLNSLAWLPRTSEACP